ncbi:EXS family-domain-containing protein [Hyaloraphidium curvatum]|nr:EXS family-domain-containing protein [Hyaloraphidium curvatum]
MDGAIGPPGYVDDPKHRDHLINAGKYFTSSCVIVASFGSKLDKGWASWAVWIGFAVASTAYSLTWDIRKDWALGKPEHGYLRGELTYPQSFYYFAMATNAVLRCSFILVLSPSYWTSLGVDGALVAFGLALLEVCRRGQWNLIRVETEHANNTDNFRVVRWVPRGKGRKGADAAAQGRTAAIQRQGYSDGRRCRRR